MKFNASDISQMSEDQTRFIEQMDNSDIALLPQKANEQHYEVPQEFYNYTLGPHGKYSCCYWAEGEKSLAAAEQAGLQKDL